MFLHIQSESEIIIHKNQVDMLYMYIYKVLL